MRVDGKATRITSRHAAPAGAARVDVDTEHGGDDGGRTAAGGESIRSGTVEKAASRVSIAWCDPGEGGGLGVLGV